MSNSPKEKPLISIITVVYNGEKYLEETIQSVLNQTYKNIEYIIIDGGSTDGTLDIIHKYEDNIAYWISEKDAGISDAFNKGIKACKGEIVGLINADDWYESNTIETVINFFNKNTECEILCGAMNLHHQGKHKIIYSHPKMLWSGMTIAHPATFIKKSVYTKMGLYELHLKYVMDYHFLLHCYYQHIKIFATKEILSNMRTGGTANTHRIEAYEEVINISKIFQNRNIIWFMYSIRKWVWKCKNLLQIKLT